MASDGPGPGDRLDAVAKGARRDQGRCHTHPPNVPRQFERWTDTVRTTPPRNARTQPMDLNLEVIVLPVSDTDRAKAFYEKLGFRLDLDTGPSSDYRCVHFTPPGSGCSIMFGGGMPAAAPGSAQGLSLIVSDIEAARAELADRGIDVSDVF